MAPTDTGPDTGTADLATLHTQARYGELVSLLREHVGADRRIFTDPLVKQWCGQRWRSLFLDYAADDEKAVRVASARVGLNGLVPSVRLGTDPRPVRQRLAERFLAQDVDDWQLELPPAPTLAPTDVALLFCPGFVYKAIPTPGLGELAEIERTHSIRVLRAATHAFRGCEDNAEDIVAAIEHGVGDDAAGLPASDPQPPDDVVLIGYSKGSADALTMLARHPEAAARVRALVCWAGAVAGSPSADDVYPRLKDLAVGGVLGDARLLAVLRMLLPVARLEGLVERPDEWDLAGAVRDLTTTTRGAFLAEHGPAIDALDIPVFNVVGQASTLDLPYFQVQGAREISKRVGPNDMQVAVEHAQYAGPMGVTLAVCKAHHWDLALGPFPRSHRLGSTQLDHPFPRLAALSATVALFTELGLLAS